MFKPDDLGNVWEFLWEFPLFHSVPVLKCKDKDNDEEESAKLSKDND
jgi:hypothetical protein